MFAVGVALELVANFIEAASRRATDSTFYSGYASTPLLQAQIYR